MPCPNIIAYIETLAFPINISVYFRLLLNAFESDLLHKSERYQIPLILFSFLVQLFCEDSFYYKATGYFLFGFM